MSKQKKSKSVRRALSAVDHQLRSDGVIGRVEAVQHAMAQPSFGYRFRAFIGGAEADTQIKGVPDLQAVLYRFLRDELALDTDDVQVYIDWQPDLGRKMTFSFGPTVAAVARAKEVLAGRLAVA